MTHHWESLGWTLVHFLWQGAAIALLYKFIDQAVVLFGQSWRNAGVRYVLALAALLGMLISSIGTLVYEEHSYAPSAERAAAADRTTPDAASSVHVVKSGAQTHSADVTGETSLAQSSRGVVNALMPYLDFLWLGGVFFCALRALGGWWLIRRLRLVTVDQAPHTLRLHLDVLRRRMGIRRLVDLRLSRRLLNPLAAGFLRPWILLPVTALTSLSPEQLEVVLTHELAHIRRADYLWNLLQTIVETLFFFHPAVWYVSRRVREEREFCCDDAVLARCPDPSVYASALVRLEEERRRSLRFAMALDGHQSGARLRVRILRILGDTEQRSKPIRPLSLTAIAAALLLFLCPLPSVFASFHPSSKAAAAVPVRQAPTQGANSNNLPANQASPPPQAEPAPKPSAATQAVNPDAVPAAQPDTTPADVNPSQSADVQPRSSGDSDYIGQMRAAGIDVDLDKYIAMKVQGITPAYVAAMTRAFGRKPTADQLIAMKVQDITADYIAQMRADGYDVPADKYIALRVQNVTPAYADAMAKLGLGKPTADELIAMKVQDVSPEEAAKLHADGIEVSSFQDLITDRIFNVSPEFVAQMKTAGFGEISAKKLVALRVQGVTPEFAKATKAQFPDADVDDLVKMRIFNIDDKFIASAKRHGFEPLTIDKLVKLRISGILDEADDTRH